MATKKKTKRAAAKTAAPPKKRLTKAQKLAEARREIARRNKIYAEASAAEKRVLIAKDVIAQLKDNRIVAESGTWTRIDLKRGAKDVVYGEQDAFQKTFLTTPEMSCNCCAVGSLFIGCTLYANKLTNDDVDDNWQLGDDIITRKRFANGFNKLFSAKQLGLIETAFEGCTEFFTDDDAVGYMAPPVSDEELNSALIGYYNKFASPKARLVAIMENIIANEGAFKP
jgi:hypothetical protein